MQVYGFLLSSLCLGGAHCELPLLAHTTAPNHAPVIHHHVSWPFLKKVAVSSSSLDYRVWHVSVKSGIVSSSFFVCSYSWLLSPCKYILRTRLVTPNLGTMSVDGAERATEYVEHWFGVWVRRTCFPSPNLPVDPWNPWLLPPVYILHLVFLCE